ncbi:MAG TPA: hypothetical protein DCZ05_01975 [Deltaproteobacteria bacterium]|nr:hypothetical protein [Deltaproteobacteria bacterium]
MRENPEAPDRLECRKLLIFLSYPLLYQGKNPRMGGDLFRTMKYQSFTPAPLPDFLLIQRDQRQEMRLAVADDHSLTDPRVRFQKILNCLRRNLLSA